MNGQHQSQSFPLVVVAISMLISIGSVFGEKPTENSPARKTSPAVKAGEPATRANAEAPQNPSPKRLPTSSKPASKDKPKKRNTDLDRQLLRDLLPDLALPADPPATDSKHGGDVKAEPRSRVPLADELDEAVEAMREVSRRLDTRDVSDETADLQSGIVSNIDALIKKLQNLPPPSSSDSSDPSNQDRSDQDPLKKSKPQTQKTRQTQAGADAASRPTSRPQTGKSGESTEQNTRQARERAAALARRRALIDEVWGHLPPVMRERLLNVGGEKLLPKYEDMIRRYYESLAEPDRASSRRPAKAGF